MYPCPFLVPSRTHSRYKARMSLVLASTSRAFRSLFQVKMVRILILAMLLNGALIAAVVGLIYIGLKTFSFVSLGWLDSFIDSSIMALSLWLSTFIYPLLLPLIISFFDTAIAEAIEEREYPEIPTPQPPFWPNLMEDVRFTGKVLLINVLIIPLYLIPLINIVAYYGINGYLLGREFFHVIAGRHIEREHGQLWRARYGLSILSAGALITFASTLPFINLIAPILGVATMVHLFHATNPPYKRYNVDTGSGTILENDV